MIFYIEKSGEILKTTPLHPFNVASTTSIVGLLSFAAIVFSIIALTGCGPKLQLTPLEPAAPPVTADSGMVVAAHPLAAEAGVVVLREGGNAIDAALAALFMLNVVEPHASGLGGEGFALVRTADGKAQMVIYRERAPRGLDTAFYQDPVDTAHARMLGGGSAVCVPGAAAGWANFTTAGQPCRWTAWRGTRFGPHRKDS